MQIEALIKKEYTKPNARLVEFNYREVVMASVGPIIPVTYDHKGASGNSTGGGDIEFNPEEDPD